MPVFKLCGHFALVVENWKYELRLRRSQVAVFNSRRLMAEELRSFREAEFDYTWIIIGWTRFSHEELAIHFRTVLEGFGLYERLSNNCRHFLRETCQHAVHVLHTRSAGYLEESTSLTIILALCWRLPLEASMGDFHDWMFRCLLGHGMLKTAFSGCY